MTAIAATSPVPPRPRVDAAPDAAGTLTAELGKAQSYFRGLGVTDQEGAGEMRFQTRADLTGVAYDSANDFVMLGSQKPGLAKPLVDNELAAQLYATRIAARMGFATELDERSFPMQVTLQTHINDVLSSAYDTDDWTIGEGTRAKPQRDMANPNSLGMPAHADEADMITAQILPKLKTNGQLVKLAQVMASVPDHAAAKFGEVIGRDEMAKLYLDTIRTSKLHDYSGVGPFAQKVTDQAATMFGAGSREFRAVEDAWKSVGMLGGEALETSFGFSG